MTKHTLLIVLGLAVAGCSGAVAPEGGGTVATANEAATKAPVAQAAHGPVKLLGDALGEVALTPVQRTEIERLAADAEARHAPIAAARQAVVETLAAQIEKGQIDRAALQAKMDAVAAAWEAARPADRAALERLHYLLDSDQRSALVDALEARIHGHMHDGARSPHGRMEEWATALELTDDQRSQIHDAVVAQFKAQWHSGNAARFHEGMEKGKHALESFKEDRFVLDEVAPPADAQEHARAMGGAMIGIVEAVVPLLTPRQRTLAAQKLRADHDDAMLP